MKRFCSFYGFSRCKDWSRNFSTFFNRPNGIVTCHPKVLQRYFTECPPCPSKGDDGDECDGGKSVKEKMFSNHIETVALRDHKVTIVGLGQVGVACTASMLIQEISNDVVMVDEQEGKMTGEMKDLQHGCIFVRNANISASTDYAASANSKVVVIAAGARSQADESRLSLLQRNVDIMKSIVPEVMKYSPDAILVIATNPVDIMSYVAWKLSCLPSHRVIGSGTNLDTARFRYFISQRLDVAPTSVYGFIIGEHGDSSVPVWSSVSVGGVRLRDLHPEAGLEGDGEDWGECHRKCVNSAYEIIKLKGYTSWGVGLSISSICRTVIRNLNTVIAVSAQVKGLYGISEEVFLSLPCIIGGEGIRDVVNITLTPKETELLCKSAEILLGYQSGIEL